MKFETFALFLFTFLCLQPCLAQQTNSLKLEDYTKGELKIKVIPFGYDDPISVGKVTADGTIHFDFTEIDLGTNNESTYYSDRKMGRAVGMFVCHDKEVEEHTETVTAIEVKDFFLYKYGQQVGALLHASEKEVLNNEYHIGSKISWFLSSGKGMFKASCIAYEEDGLGKGGLNKNDLRNRTTYNINFKKGWNIVEHKLLEIKKVEISGQEYNRRLIEDKSSVANIPETINWYLNYWANNELIELEHNLVKQVPISKAQYENWLPKKLGKLKRKEYEIGKKLERIEVLNNIDLVFEKGIKNANVTIIDCAQDKSAAGNYTLILSMASEDWKETTETGYSGAMKMDNTRVVVEYDEKVVKSSITYTANDRFVIISKAININPEELWGMLKKLKLDDLIN